MITTMTDILEELRGIRELLRQVLVAQRESKTVSKPPTRVMLETRIETLIMEYAPAYCMDCENERKSLVKLLALDLSQSFSIRPKP